MTLLVVFGTPGAGKSYVGRILNNEFGYFHYDTDDDLTPEMINAVKSEQCFTNAMREAFCDISIKKTKALQTQYPNVVVSQALIKEKFRQTIKNHFPSSLFIYVTADSSTIHKRLKIRNNLVSIAYADKISAVFEEPHLPHIKIDNNHNEPHIINQLKKFLR